MYHVIQQKDGSWACEGRLQDSTERWSRPTLALAIQSMIRFARVTNGSIIRQKDINVHEYVEVEKPSRLVTEAEWNLLYQIHCGNKIVLDRLDKRLVYKIDDEDCETIREGEYIITKRRKR